MRPPPPDRMQNATSAGADDAVVITPLKAIPEVLRTGDVVLTAAEGDATVLLSTEAPDEPIAVETQAPAAEPATGAADDEEPEAAAAEPRPLAAPLAELAFDRDAERAKAVAVSYRFDVVSPSPEAAGVAP